MQLIQISETHLILLISKQDNSKQEMFKFLSDSNYPMDPLQKIKNEERQIEWLCTRFSLAKHFGKTVEVKYDEHQKPHLGIGMPNISISHTDEKIAISLQEKASTGIDIQKIKPKLNRVAHKYLKASELNQLTLNSDEDYSFCWSIKEAVFKWHGRKNIYLKDDISILEYHHKEGYALAKIDSDSEAQKIKVRLQLVEDNSLAYTVIV